MQASLPCGARGCTVLYGKREALEGAVQADSGVHATAVGRGARTDDDEESRLHGLCYSWDQDTLGIAGPLDDAPLEYIEQRFIKVVKP